MARIAEKAGRLLCLALLFGVAACGGSDSEEAAAGGPAEIRPAYAPGDTVGVSGVLIDTRCFHLDRQENGGADHSRRADPSLARQGCAASCARQGWPVAVLEGGRPAGYVWVLSFPSQVFADYMGKTVRLRGEFRSAGILVPLRVEMQTEAGWTAIL